MIAAAYKIPQSVLVVIHTAAREVLLLRRADADDFWQSVTGSKDRDDEPLLTTAAREVGEETGFACGPGSALATKLVDWGLENVYEIAPRWQRRYAPGVKRNTEHVYGLQLPTALTPVLSPQEHTAFQWLPYAEAAQACFSHSNAQAILMLPRFLHNPS